MNKKEIVNLLKRNKYTYRELSRITGYHEKSLVRLNTQIKNGTISIEHGNKNRKPHNFINNEIKNSIIKEFNTGNYKSYQDFYNQQNNKYSYSFISKVLSSNYIKATKNSNYNIKRKMISDNTIQYKNIRYKVIGIKIKHHEEVILNPKNLYITYKNKKYKIKPIKTVESRTGLTKYY